ncbi:MAG: hypothetical protein LBB77_11565 [Treponema sp.]|jgi:phosphoglycerate dehydrogenase-like enzyme|nr:hypothetical protein [Treponema sp.]
MTKPVCFCGIALHPRAYRDLALVFDVTSDTRDLDRVDAALVYGVPGEWLGRRPEKLKNIACHLCEGEAAAWAAERGIAVFESSLIWRTVAEHTAAMMFAAARNIAAADADIRAGRWKDHENLKIQHAGFGLYGKTVGIWGLGRIGKLLAPMLAGFGTRILYHDLCGIPGEIERPLGLIRADLDDMLSRSDFLVVLLPLDNSTCALLNRDLFGKMKRGSILINTARAAIIEEAAFREALDSGILAGAALDVLWTEGGAQPEWLCGNRRVTLTPHLGGSTYECDIELVDALRGGLG